MSRPLVALVGRPNVGKSALFNRLVGERMAIVEDVPGTTRDRLVAESEWNGVDFDVVDTGGLTEETESDLELKIRNQAELAIEQADVVILVTDVKMGVTSTDQAVAARLRRGKKPVVLAVNKADSLGRRLDAPEFWALGLGTPYPVSALHGTGTGDMLDAVVDLLPQPAEESEPDGVLAVAIVGRPNVGKSSLVNRLVGQERVIVSAEAGTTRDPIDTLIEFEGRPVKLVDTAGIRRRGRVEPGIEKYAVLRATRAVERADVAVIVVDAIDGVTAQDAHLAGAVAEAGVGAIVALNKWDAVDTDEQTVLDETAKVRNELQFLDYAPVLFISALTGLRVHKVMETVIAVAAERTHRIATADLNRLVADIQARHNPPSKFGKRLRIYYATQVGVSPPRFAFFVNDTRLVHFTYARFVENQLRRLHPYTGTPVRLSFRNREGDATEDPGRRRVPSGRPRRSGSRSPR